MKLARSSFYHKPRKGKTMEEMRKEVDLKDIFETESQEKIFPCPVKSFS